MESNAEGIPEQTFTKELNAKTTSLLKANADPSNWEDQELPSSVWTKADNRWQAFAKRWRDHNGPVYKEVDGARIIDLSDICDLVADLPPSILVRTCYDDAVIATLQTAAGASGSGMIFTGQPGIGKTTFLLYLLVVLLQRKQLVLLTLVPSKPPLLFYHDGVYNATTSPHIEHFPFPNCERGAAVLIWSLFEANEECVPESAYSAPILFPVQASSPNPKLYARWRKERGAVLSAFPLWGFDELKQGLRLQREFTLLQEELGSMLETWQDHSHDSDPSLTYSRALQRLRVACGDKQPESVDVAVDVLLEASIAAFGLVARDVFRATCEPAGYDNLLSLHKAVYVGYEELKEILGAAKGSNKSGIHVYHRAVCIVPDGSVGQPVMDWSVTFKSDMIAQRISEKWADAQEGRVRELMKCLSAAPAGKALVVWFFAALAHRRILAGAGGEEYWSLKPMTLQKPSTFVLNISAVSVPRISKKARRRVRFDTQDITSERLELRDDEYYIPKIAANFSLIDSFLVSFEPGPSAAVPSADLWLFQMTTSARHHRGSSRTGYDRIQNIISMLKKQLGTQTSHEEPPKKRMKSEEVEVRVHYVLACAAGKDSEFEQIQQWTLPPGLADKARGDGYLMELDVLHSTQAGG
ncbi:hypothetical protein C8Q74DRAFT_1368075 [Fomes fomentarius]|nr:hypothetical protein C8Q74DRAFT_1368075 [Fomes fomentarius]